MKNMEKKISGSVVTLSVLAILFLLISGQPVAAANEQFDTVETYEENMFLPAYDIWINQTAPALVLNSIGDNNGFRAVHYMLFPDSIDMSDLIILDPSVRIRFGLFGQNMDHYQIDQSSNLDLSAVEDKSEAGNTEFASRDTDRVRNYDAADLMTDEGHVVTASYDHFNGTATSFATVEQNYTIPKNEVSTGVVYEAGDDKSVNDWGKEISEADGGTFIEVLNASMVGFGFETFDQLEGVNWGFAQDDDTSSLILSGFSVKGIRVALHNTKNKISKSAGGLWSSTKRSVDNTVFKKIKNAGSSLAAVASGAKQFFTKKLPSFAHGLIGKVTSIGKGILGAFKGLIPIILVILGIAIFFYFGFHKKLRRS